jgi:hypothetical protein
MEALGVARLSRLPWLSIYHVAGLDLALAGRPCFTIWDTWQLRTRFWPRAKTGPFGTKGARLGAPDPVLAGRWVQASHWMLTWSSTEITPVLRGTRAPLYRQWVPLTPNHFSIQPNANDLVSKIADIMKEQFDLKPMEQLGLNRI